MLGSVLLQAVTLQTVWERVTTLLEGLGRTSVDILLAALVGLVGWVIARLASSLTLAVLRAVHFNEAIRRLRSSGGGPLRFEPAALASWAVHWSLVVLTVMAAADALGFGLSQSVGQRLREALPRVMAATIELVIGIALAMALGAVTRRVFETAGFRQSRIRGQVVTVVLSAFAVLLALEQLGLAAQFIVATGVIVLSAVGIAAGLAFGLGCRDLARDFVVEYLRSMDEESPQPPR